MTDNAWSDGTADTVNRHRDIPVVIVLRQKDAPWKNADDEIDILELVGVLLAKWPILAVFVVLGTVSGFIVSNYIRPVFSSDALLQVDLNGNSASLAMGEMGALLDAASPADAEIQLIRSRRVLSVVVDKEHLSYGATPVALLPRLLPNHMESVNTADMPEFFRQPRFEGNSMKCKKLTMLPVECIVRGYITGSGWESYKKTGKVCGIQLPEGLLESQKLPEPIYTPSTKAEIGDHDENISFEQSVEYLEKRFRAG